jgi:hypothetical protein
MKMWTCENLGASSDRKASMRKSWRGNWDYEKSTNESFGAVFEKKARDHAVRQAGAKEEIRDTLNRNARRSYASLEKAINQWCSKMQDDYCALPKVKRRFPHVLAERQATPFGRESAKASKNFPACPQSVGIRLRTEDTMDHEVISLPTNPCLFYPH